ncbi:hypothetical protein RINTHH_21760 [Richelia intracellularis HH01]|mgnify:CR=1 FL=1|jgi:thioredoxin 1|uniref:Uncharacterized protein n=1 Tax=Richelia intracellularis HH01 TaxID=1165094 RepID=M1X6P7_9NOST|nr:hypothetical protein RINTHH_21760 [Richelia intracellularis HH01]
MKIVCINADENFKSSNIYRIKSLQTLILINNVGVSHCLKGFLSLGDIHLALKHIQKTVGKPL